MSKKTPQHMLGRCIYLKKWLILALIFIIYIDSEGKFYYTHPRKPPSRSFPLLISFWLVFAGIVCPALSLCYVVFIIFFPTTMFSTTFPSNTGKYKLFMLGVLLVILQSTLLFQATNIFPELRNNALHDLRTICIGWNFFVFFASTLIGALSNLLTNMLASRD